MADFNKLWKSVRDISLNEEILNEGKIPKTGWYIEGQLHGSNPSSFDVYHDGKLVTNLDSKKEAEEFVDAEKAKDEFKIKKTDSGFIVYDKNDKVVGSYPTREDAKKAIDNSFDDSTESSYNIGEEVNEEFDDKFEFDNDDDFIKNAKKTFENSDISLTRSKEYNGYSFIVKSKKLDKLVKDGKIDSYELYIYTPGIDPNAEVPYRAQSCVDIEAFKDGEDVYTDVGWDLRKDRSLDDVVDIFVSKISNLKVNEESRDDKEELVKVYVKADGEWRVLYDSIPESKAIEIWRAVFAGGKNLISIETEAGKRVKEMNKKTMNKSKKED